MGQFNPNLLPESFRKRMAKEQRKELGVTTMDEVNAKRDLRVERKQHEMFINWLQINEIFFDHQAMHRRTSNRAGTPDFLCLKNGFGCAVEFKAGDNKLSEDQVRTKYKAGQAGVPFAVCYSVEEAIAFTKRYLQL